MASHSFKAIPQVPTSSDFVDIVLSKTHRKSASIVHPGFRLSRIQEFYQHKVLLTRDTIQEKLKEILDSFPRIEDIHPFYSDLLNVLYDKDHFKLALGHLAKARMLADGIGKDFHRLLKHGENAFACKNLKKAALGRMCKVLRKLKPSLEFLEAVRQHMRRLPSIDPTMPTLLVAGFPNVGKSSFMREVTRADVDVQDYPFTTQSIHVGHCDYRSSRWQVLDTPGILDRSLEERNAIEMASITALAHLQACILFFVDVSDEASYSVADQMSLLKSLEPITRNKPLLVVATKTDKTTIDEMQADERELLFATAKELGAPVMSLSNKTHDGVMDVRNEGCQMLQAARVAARKREPDRVDSIMGRLRASVPKPRDGKRRSAAIPPSVIAARRAGAGGALPAEIAGARHPKEGKEERAALSALRTSRREGEWKEGGDYAGLGGIRGSGPNGQLLLRDFEREAGGAGLFTVDLMAERDLREEWKYDIIPEIKEGRNTADFIDLDVWKRMDALDEEEEEFLAAREAAEAAGADPLDVVHASHAGASNLPAPEVGRRGVRHPGGLDEPRRDVDDEGALLAVAADTILRRADARSALTGAALKRAGYTPEQERALAKELETRRLVATAEAAADRKQGSRLPRRLRPRGVTEPGRREAMGRALPESRRAERIAREDEEDRIAGGKRKRSHSVRRGRSVSRGGEGGDGMDDGTDGATAAKVRRAASRSRSAVRGVTHDPEASRRDLGTKDLQAKFKEVRAARRAQTKLQHMARKGEGDRHIPDLKPKHLYSGKRGIGKTDWR